MTWCHRDIPKALANLGRRERQIMDIVVRRPRSSVAEVPAELPDPPSYSSVRGMLRLLQAKGYARHEWDGPRFVYVATADPVRLREDALADLVETFSTTPWSRPWSPCSTTRSASSRYRIEFRWLTRERGATLAETERRTAPFELRWPAA
jgi:predicted transcriptional regulator